MAFLEEELHEHLSAALIKLHDLIQSEDEQIALEASSRLAQLIIEVTNQQNALADIEIDEFYMEDEDDG